MSGRVDWISGAGPRRMSKNGFWARADAGARSTPSTTAAMTLARKVPRA